MIFRKFINSIVYSHIWISIGASTLIAQVVFLLHKDWLLNYSVGFVFGSTLMIYSMHRLIGLSVLKEIKAMLNLRYQIIGQSQRRIIVLLYLGAIISIAFFFQLKRSTQLFMFVPGILSLLYVLPLLSKRKRLRDFGEIKIFLIAIVWASVAVIIPYLEGAYIIDRSALLLFLEKAIFIFAITLPFDIRDLKVDETFGTKTIPGTIGVKRTKLLAYLLICLASILVICNRDLYSHSGSLAIVISYIVTLFFIYRTNENRKDFFYSFWMDGTIIFQTLLIFLASLI